MAVLKEFKDFAMRGNVVDMAVGVIIGTAFGKIVSTFVNDVIMPPIGLLVGNVDFKHLSFVLRPATESKPEVKMNYGLFINTVIDFAIVAFVIFAVVKGLNSLKKKEEAKPSAPPAPSNQEVLLMEIRDILKQKKI